MTYQMYEADIDVVAAPSESPVHIIQALIPAGKRRRIRIITRDGPAGGNPLVRIRLGENEMRRFLSQYFDERIHEPFLQTLTKPPLPPYQGTLS